MVLIRQAGGRRTEAEEKAGDGAAASSPAFRNIERDRKFALSREVYGAESLIVVISIRRIPLKAEQPADQAMFHTSTPLWRVCQKQPRFVRMHMKYIVILP